MDKSAPNLQTLSAHSSPHQHDLHPLCCAATMPAPASWEKAHHLSPHLTLSRPLNRSASYVLVAYVMSAVGVGLNLLTPLYGLYRQRFDFSALTLTLIFATYVLTIIPAMLLFGPLADAFGRRRILLFAILASALADGLLLAASGTPWLFAARIVQGIAQGALSGAGSAALIELGTDLKKTALVIAATASGGIALGPILSGVLAQYAPAPFMLSFVVHLVLLAVALLGALLIIEPLAEADRRPFHAHRPTLPAEGKAAFLTATVIAALAFGASSLFLSVIPSFLSGLLQTTNIALLMAPVGLFLGIGPLVQVLFHRLSAQRAAFSGLGLEVVGLISTIFTASVGSLSLLLLAALVGGCGVGLAYLGALSLINQIIPKEQRGDVFGTFYALIYLSLGATSISVGWLTVPLGLAVAVRWVSIVVVVLCLLTLLLAPRVLRAGA